MSTKHRKSAMGRSRDFGTEGAGKGDANRVSDVSAYRENYDAIDWKRPGVKTRHVSSPFVDLVEDRSKPNPDWIPNPDGPKESWDR